MNIGYVAVETFFPNEKYKEWSKLYHIEEIVSIDCALCPRILRDECIEDRYIYLQGYGFYDDILNNLEVVLEMAKNKEDKNILAVLRDPKSDCSNRITDIRFKFYGYDLLEDDTRISALTNCEGFDEAFSTNDISEYGLIKNFKKAKQVQQLLIEKYPDEEHADCSLWAIWRMETDV